MIDKTFRIDYHKRKVVNLGDFVDGNCPDDVDDPFILDKLQQYNPLYTRFFNLNENNFNKIALNHKYHIKNKTEVYEVVSVDGVESVVDLSRNIFFKFSPLLDSIKYMIGKYELDNRITNVPSILSTPDNCHEKMLCLHNASYVDNFFYFLSSILLNTHNFVHGIDYYGSFLGVQKSFKVNITEDLEYLTTSDFFLDNIGTLFTSGDISNNNTNERDTRTQKNELILGDDIVDLPVCDDVLNHAIDSEIVEVGINELVEFHIDEIDLLKDDDNFDNFSDSSSDNSETNYSEIDEEQDENISEDKDETEYDDEYEEGEEDEGDDSTDCSSSFDEELFAYIKNFPTQMICLEKCEKTLDQILVEEDYDEEQMGSILFQVVMTLLTYKKLFNFTHNDLHTNNIMFVNTEDKFIWYKYNGFFYKVPTYGRICKLIDFGRSIYKFGENIFCSDSFSVGGDGSTQYNCEPFLDTSKKCLEPNFSFDLCRLGCSLYEFILDDDRNSSKMTPLQKTIMRWVTDDNGHNVLYRKDGSFRYKGFKLYRMIARTVSQHTPENQLKFEFFDKFKQDGNKKCKEKSKIMNIDNLPIYFKT